MCAIQSGRNDDLEARGVWSGVTGSEGDDGGLKQLTNAHSCTAEGGAVDGGDGDGRRRRDRDEDEARLVRDLDAVDTWDWFGGSQLRSEMEAIWNGSCSRSFETSKNSTREEKTDSTVFGGRKKEKQRSGGRSDRQLDKAT